MKSLKLNEQVSIPVLGFGTWQITGDVCVRSVTDAIEIGYRHIDTADAYGNHAEVAQGIKQSGIARDELFVTTKVWNTNHEHESVLQSGQRFLEELQMEYIDLLLIHWPVQAVPVAETLGAMQELKAKGLVRAIGVSNFTEHHVQDVLDAGIDISNNQVEVHPTFNQKDLREFCASHNIAVTAYSPLGHGNDLSLPLMVELAEKYSVTPALISLAWCLARQMIAIPKSSNRMRIEENFNASQLELEEADLARIDLVAQGDRTCSPAFNEFDY